MQMHEIDLRKTVPLDRWPFLHECESVSSMTRAVKKLGTHSCRKEKILKQSFHFARPMPLFQKHFTPFLGDYCLSNYKSLKVDVEMSLRRMPRSARPGRSVKAASAHLAPSVPFAVLEVNC